MITDNVKVNHLFRGTTIGSVEVEVAPANLFPLPSNPIVVPLNKRFS